jgi:hypothetical protein
VEKFNMSASEDKVTQFKNTYENKLAEAKQYTEDAIYTANVKDLRIKRCATFSFSLSPPMIFAKLNFFLSFLFRFLVLLGVGAAQLLRILDRHRHGGHGQERDHQGRLRPNLREGSREGHGLELLQEGVRPHRRG